jgi:hypothetical protein
MLLRSGCSCQILAFGCACYISGVVLSAYQMAQNVFLEAGAIS